MSSDQQRMGVIFVISSPSGAGKTTLARRLLDAHEDLVLSVSATTRTPREGEVDGVHYHFMDRPAFEADARAGRFYEHATVHGNFYGTPKGPVLKQLEQGLDVLLDIDWQGAQQLFQRRDGNIATVFILPPSMSELERRLRFRASDEDAVIDRRLKGAREEITHWAEYGYVLINRDIDESFSNLSAILTAERLKRNRQPWLPNFVQTLLRESA
jgi:guanylate kinase